MQELRGDIRTYKQTLTSANGSASAADVRERMIIEANLQKSETIADELDEAFDNFELLAREFSEYSAELDNFSSDTSAQDEGKLHSLETSFISQLEQYGFSSIKPASLLRISRETYRPTYEGFDLGFNLSASDMIRTIWAYLYGLLEVSETWNTNHIGLLVLDEPRQQQANKASFAEFAKRVASARKSGAQVILLTSEDADTLSLMLSGLDYQYVNFDEKMIQPLQI